MQTFNGCIIHITELEEKGRYLKVLTERGIVDIFMRGAKKTTSKNNAGTEHYCYSKFSVAASSRGGETRYTLDSSESLQQFYELRLDIKKLALAAYFAHEIETGGVVPETLNLLLLCLFRLCENTVPERIIKAAFELRYACEIGFMPDLTGCAVCHKYDGDLSLNLEHGKLYCSEHCSTQYSEQNSVHIPGGGLTNGGFPSDGLANGGFQGDGLANGGFPLSPALLHALRFVCLSDIKKICDFTLVKPSSEQLSYIAETYLALHTERQFRNKSLEYYKKL
jgi:DNA repair protein RecO (recombination protein O)